MEIAQLNLLDENYSARLPDMGFSEFKPTKERFNQRLNHLRQAHQSMQQKERFFDHIIAESQLSVLLFDRSQHIVYCNPSAEKLLLPLRPDQAHPTPLTGKHYDELLTSLPAAWKNAISSLYHQAGDTLLQSSEPFTRESESITDRSYHISSRQVNLYNHPHCFILIREMTEQLTRSEVETWKKAIRVISHELNNSLAPISSMTRSAQMLIEKERWERIPEVLDNIKGNTQNLSSFIQRYAKFARLPKPNKAKIDWEPWLNQLNQQYHFSLAEIPNWLLEADKAQMSQVIINLLKNAHESGSPVDDIELKITQISDSATDHSHAYKTQFILFDRGCGMSNEVLKQATLPFYSTKSLGSGLGLALGREIVEAHGGHFWIHRREGGGLEVGFSL